MQSKINFKSGLFTGSVLGILLLFFGYYTFQKITTKAEDIANIDLYQFEYVDLDGKNISLSDYQGKHLLVNFWATWCAPCIKEFPVLNEAHQLLKEDFVFVMVSDQSINKIKAFTETKPYSFIYLKTNNLLLKGIATVPQTFVFDKTGIKKQHHPTIFEGSAQSIADTLQKWIKK
jgi:thiol-disulfide isomerase/thioredoxin